jgi:CheY-like chemotaxis protein
MTMPDSEQPNKRAPRILLVDDDRQFLRVYRELLAKQPSQPEVRTAESGSRALAKLESDQFDLLVCDLKMAQVDGFQVLAIVRRRFPQLRTVVITGLAEEQFRARAYALGVDLFLEKPASPEEGKLFLECIESLLGCSVSGGFRGVQSKSLVDIIQLECLSLSSSVLKVVQGVQEGRIWFLNGEIVDADAGGLNGEAAFRKILSWKTGAFEILPPEPEHPRTIFGSYQSLLLETAQALDESLSAASSAAPDMPERPAPLAEVGRHPGIEFILATGERNHVEAWGVENAEKLARWTRETVKRFHGLGERLKIGELGAFNGSTSQRQLVVVRQGERTVCLGAQKALSPEQLRETLNQLCIQWAS